MIYLGENPIGLNHMISQIGTNARIESGIYIPQVDEVASEIQIPHSLGIVPDFILCYCDNFESSSTYTEVYVIFGICCIINVSSLTSPGIKYCLLSRPGATNIGTNAQLILPESISTNTYFTIPCSASTDKLKANVSYRYVLGKFNTQEVTPNA